MKAGDSKQAATARRRLAESGLLQALQTTLCEWISDHRAGIRRLIDVGCGEGTLTAVMQQAMNAEACGVDLSIPAIELASKSHSTCRWIVANADRTLPVVDASMDLVTSITACKNASEFRRVLAAGGRLLVAVSAPEDLIELREAVQGEGKLVDRTARIEQMFGDHFDLVDRRRVQSRQQLLRSALEDLLASTYRGKRNREQPRVQALVGMQVTIAYDLLWFGPRR